LLGQDEMRALLVLVPSLVACSSQNVAPLSEFGPIEAYIGVELGPLAGESGDLDVNPRVFAELSHNNPACPVFDDDIDVSIDGVRPDSLEPGYYDEGGGYGHDTEPSCQSPYFTIDRVPPAKPVSVLRLADATAEMSLEVDRLFVNPVMTIATPLVHGQAARIDVADDRQITMVDAVWWVGDEESRIGYDAMPTVAANGIALTMPSAGTGPGWLEVRVELAAPELTCNGFSTCAVSIKGSAKLDGTLE
jgi:hypothetical protein